MRLVILLAFVVCRGWDYTDFAKWNTIDARCGHEANQSPRRLSKADAVLSHQCKTIKWSNSKPRNFKVKNSGHGITMTPILRPGETAANTFSWDNATWCLEQFHFHWSKNDHGAEHRIENFESGLEAHFVHRDCRFDNLTQALKTQQAHVGIMNAVAVIGLLYQVDAEGGEILGNLLNSGVITSDVVQGTGQLIVYDLDYTAMLPDISRRQMYSYQGSLTTPTCDPVLWFVMKCQEKITPAELALLRMIKDKSGEEMTSNQRPLQANTQTLFFYEPCLSSTCSCPKCSCPTPERKKHFPRFWRRPRRRRRRKYRQRYRRSRDHSSDTSGGSGSGSGSDSYAHSSDD